MVIAEGLGRTGRCSLSDDPPHLGRLTNRVVKVRKTGANHKRIKGLKVLPLCY
jgi:hypothetical protein